MIYLYGVIEATAQDAATALDGVQGLQAPVAVSAAGPWTIVHSAQDDAEILPKRRLMLAHTRVVEQTLTVGPVLPARFGLVSDSLDQTVALVTAQADLVAQEFAQVRDTAEFGLRVRFPREAVLAATLAEDPGLRAERDALKGRGADAHFAMAEFGGRLADRLDRRRGQAQNALLRALVPLARDHLLRAPEEDVEVLRAEFLLPTQSQATFETTVQTAVADLAFAPGAEPTIQIVGPAPAYNFVRLNLQLPKDEAA